MCTVFIDISMDYSNKVSKHPLLIPWLNTHDSSLCNSNQDKCEPTAWVIPGPIAFVYKNKAQEFLLELIDVFNRAEND